MSPDGELRRGPSAVDTQAVVSVCVRRMVCRLIPGHAPADAGNSPTSLEWAEDGELASADLKAILRRLELADGGQPHPTAPATTSPLPG